MRSIVKALTFAAVGLASPLLILVFANTTVRAQPTSHTAEERSCYNLVQGKQRWNRAGATNWSDTNVWALCNGTTNATATVDCFRASLIQVDNYAEGITKCAAKPAPVAGMPTSPSSTQGTPYTVSVTIRNNSGFNAQATLFTHSSGVVVGGTSQTFTRPFTETGSSEFDIKMDNAQRDQPTVQIFYGWLQVDPSHTSYCFNVSGTFLVPVVTSCNGGAAVGESPYIVFRNESGFSAKMTLEYYDAKANPLSTETDPIGLGYQRRVYLPGKAETSQPMSLKVIDVGRNRILDRVVDKNSFDTAGTTCYKVWGSLFSEKVSPCTIAADARKISISNKGAFQTKLVATYYSKNSLGQNIAYTVSSNPLEVLESDTVVIPKNTSTTPIRLSFYNNWTGKVISTTTVAGNFGGTLCYQIEGTAISPNVAQCNGTVGPNDRLSADRQIRFQNDAGYDAQMTVMYFMDKTISGVKIPSPTTVSTGYINGLAGKYRLVTIPMNTSPGQPITVTLTGSGTINNPIWATTVPGDFKGSSQPCFKVTGTVFNATGAKCN